MIDVFNGNFLVELMRPAPGQPSPLSIEDGAVVADKLEWAMRKFGIIDDNNLTVTKRRIAHLCAQLAEESGFKAVSENLMYSAAGLRRTWPNRFSITQALTCQYQPQKIAAIAYGDRMGNTSASDGYVYRGRGFIQLTGRAGYSAYGPIISKYSGVNLDLVANPDLLLQIGVSALIACAFFTIKKDAYGKTALAYADSGELGSVEAITLVINGGRNGLAERQVYFGKASKLLR
jgi:putative chitinase